MKQIQSYTYTIPANGSLQIPAANDNFIVQAATGPVTVRGDTFGTLPGLVAGQGLKLVPFNRLELIDVSGAPNTVTLLLSPAEFVNQVFSGSVGVVGAIALTTATLNTLVRPELPTGNWKDTSTLVANTPLTVFAPGANVNGALIHMLAAHENFTSSQNIVFIAKASAPSSVSDGEVVAQGIQRGIISGTECMGIDQQMPTRIAAGLGLYFITGGTGAAGRMRSARFTLL